VKRPPRNHRPPLPARDGVSPSCVALPGKGWDTVLDFLAHRLPAVSRADWAERMERGEVLDAQGHAVVAAARFRPNEKLYYYRSLPSEAALPFEERVVFQDEWLVVADKPHFMPVTPSGPYLHHTLLVRLKRRLGIDTLVPIHRIDRDTAGLVVFCVRPDTRDAYQRLFRERSVDKRYEAIAPWHEDLVQPRLHRSRLVESPAFMQMHEVAGEPNAETAIALIERRGDWARYELRPATGQKHQLRAHMAALGVPIRHDRIYPVLDPRPSDPLRHAPLQLLARALAFTDPVTGQARAFALERSLSFDD
jgi:tRNA pseudouridine32 synthase/23S rRNA pseudouridine746 synthase